MKPLTIQWLFCLLVLMLVPGCKSGGPKPRSGSGGPAMGGPVIQQPMVTFQGEVRNQVVPWSEGLKLSEALDAAEYTGRNDPMSIYIFSKGKKRHVSPRRLLSGTDDPLLAPGDNIQIVR